jgi:hypothetical protein
MRVDSIGGEALNGLSFTEYEARDMMQTVKSHSISTTYLVIAAPIAPLAR